MKNGPDFTFSIKLKQICSFTVFYDFEQNIGNCVCLHYKSDEQVLNAKSYHDLVLHVPNLALMLLSYSGQLSIIYPGGLDKLRYFQVKFENNEDDDQMSGLN